MAGLVPARPGANTSGMHPLTLRSATRADVPRLVALNAAAYPELLADGVVFDASQLLAHTHVFAEGQIVAEENGVIVGAIATLIVGSSAAMKPHAWTDITSFGTFACHDPRGDALYLADVYADPAVHGRGVGAVPLRGALRPLQAQEPASRCRRRAPLGLPRGLVQDYAGAICRRGGPRRPSRPRPHVPAARRVRGARRPRRLPRRLAERRVRDPPRLGEPRPRGARAARRGTCSSGADALGHFATCAARMSRGARASSPTNAASSAENAEKSTGSSMTAPASMSPGRARASRPCGRRQCGEPWLAPLPLTISPSKNEPSRGTM